MVGAAALKTAGPQSLSYNSRHNSFDVLRLVSALMVLCGHAYILARQHPPEIFGIPVHTLGLFNLFIISGYLTTLSWYRSPDIRVYLAKRALRIFPGLSVTLLFLAAVIGPLLTTEPLKLYFTNPYTYLFVLRNSALWYDDWLPGVFSKPLLDGSANGALWTLPIEFALYFIVILLAWPTKYSKHLYGVLIFVVSMWILWLSMITPFETDVKIYQININETIEIAPFFFIGSVIALVNRIGRLPHINGYSLIGLFILLVIAGYIPDNWNYIFVAPLLSVFILLAGESKYLHMPALKRSGDLSYGVYLFHWPVESAFVELFGLEVPAWSLALGAAAICLPYAWVLWHFIEAPSLSMKQRLPKAVRTGKVLQEASQTD